MKFYVQSERDAYARGRADGLREAIEAVKADFLRRGAGMREYDQHHQSQEYELAWSGWRAVKSVLTKLRRLAAGAASASKGEK